MSKPRAPYFNEIETSNQSHGGVRLARIRWGAENDHPEAICELRLYRHADGTPTLKIVRIDPSVAVIREEKPA